MFKGFFSEIIKNIFLKKCIKKNGNFFEDYYLKEYATLVFDQEKLILRIHFLYFN